MKTITDTIFIIMGSLCSIAGILVVFSAGAACCCMGWYIITNHNDINVD